MRHGMQVNTTLFAWFATQQHHNLIDAQMPSAYTNLSSVSSLLIQLLQHQKVAHRTLPNIGGCMTTM